MNLFPLQTWLLRRRTIRTLWSALGHCADLEQQLTECTTLTREDRNESRRLSSLLRAEKRRLEDAIESNVNGHHRPGSEVSRKLATDVSDLVRRHRELIEELAVRTTRLRSI